MRIHPVILSGGSGTRLWPVSQPHRPKQFLSLVTQNSMLQEAMMRAADSSRFAPPLFVANARHGDLIAAQAQAVDFTPSAILLEPEGRNTAAAIAIAAEWIVGEGGDDLMLVMPSDQLINDVPAFHQAIAVAAQAAGNGMLVTFGVQPHRPETGYGYIERGDALAVAPGAFRVARFEEKPKADVAAAYLAGGRHYWNAGIFLFKASAFLEELGHYAPEVRDSCHAAMRNSARDDLIVRPAAQVFAASPDISIDYAVMERTAFAAVVPVDMGWSDIGSWDALWEVQARDDSDSWHQGPSVSIDGRGNLIYIDGGPPVGAVGLNDMIVVSSRDGVLILPRDRCQDVKLIAQQLKGLIQTA
jgi:mannose-1-phosphate guanylyltransferase/mannose-6-phosphate isomerase